MVISVYPLAVLIKTAVEIAATVEIKLEDLNSIGTVNASFTCTFWSRN